MPTHFLVGKADDIVEETGKRTRCTAGVGDPASKHRLLEITSGSCRGQQGLVTTCKDSPDEAKNRRRREPNGSGAWARTSDDGGVMLSQEVGNVSPTEVTPELGEGALDTWRPSQSTRRPA